MFKKMPSLDEHNELGTDRRNTLNAIKAKINLFKQNSTTSNDKSNRFVEPQ